MNVYGHIFLYIGMAAHKTDFSERRTAMKRTVSLPLSRKLNLAADALTVIIFAILGVLLIGLLFSELSPKSGSVFAPDYVYNAMLVDPDSELPDPMLTLNKDCYPQNLFSVGYERAATIGKETLTIGVVLTFADGVTRTEYISLMPCKQEVSSGGAQ